MLELGGGWLGCCRRKVTILACRQAGLLPVASLLAWLPQVRLSRGKVVTSFVYPWAANVAADSPIALGPDGPCTPVTCTREAVQLGGLKWKV